MKKHYDVVVVGAGVSGVAAAVASARGGVSTLLVEKNAFIGGATIMGLHQAICGLYLNGEDKPQETLNDGIVREVVNLLQSSPVRVGRVYVLPYRQERLLEALQILIDKESNLDVLCNSELVGIVKENDLIRSIKIGDSSEIDCSVVVDCSGKAIVLSGARYELADRGRRQLCGYTFRIDGLCGGDDVLAWKVPYQIREAINKRKIPSYLKFTTFSTADNSQGYCKLSILPTDDEGRHYKAQQDALLLHRYLSKAIPAFKGTVIGYMSDQVVDREGLRACGEYTLNSDDVLRARKFDDGIVKNSWPIEAWDQQRGPTYRYLESGQYYEIPLRCLKVKGIVNLYCAGRCISVTQQALGSTRVMGPCISLGERAGLTAACGVLG